MADIREAVTRFFSPEEASKPEQKLQTPLHLMIAPESTTWENPLQTMQVISAIVQHAETLGIGYLTFELPENVADETIQKFYTTAAAEIPQLLEGTTRRISHMGSLEKTPEIFQNAITKEEQQAREKPSITVSFAVQGTGRQEFVEAVKQMTADGIAKGGIDESKIKDYLDRSRGVAIPDPDLIIYTGEDSLGQDDGIRTATLHGTTIFDAAYSELQPTIQPFTALATKEGFLAILQEFNNRERRFGGLPGTPSK